MNKKNSTTDDSKVKYSGDAAERRRQKVRERAEWCMSQGETAGKNKIMAQALVRVITILGLGIFGISALIIYIFMEMHSKNYLIPFILVPVNIIFWIIYGQKKKEFEEEAYQLSLVWRKDAKKEEVLRDAYGVKGWATREQLDKMVPMDTPGVWIGNGFEWLDRGHLLTVGSNSAGKGSNFIVPCLLSGWYAQSGGSFICLDPKGENALITKRRVAETGFEVHVLNPFGIDGLPNSRFNPFSYISKDDDNVIEYCDMLAEMVIPIRSGNDATADHFDTQARSILSSYMLHLVDIGGDKKNFAELFKWANYGGTQLDTLLAQMTTSDSYRGILASIIGGFNETRLAGGEKEASGILSTMKKGLEPFKNFKLQDSTETSDFDFREIAKKQMGVYVCIPQSEMAKNSVWMRLVMGCAIKLLQKHFNKERKVLFIMDEFPTLGYMREFEQNAGLMAGYNVSFWVILQLLPQLQTLYPKMWETFVANASVKHFLGIGDVTTAEYVSKLMPNDLITVRQGAEDIREIQKKLMDPSEILSDQNIIMFLSKLDRPVYLPKLPYYQIEWMKDLADERPML